MLAELRVDRVGVDPHRDRAVARGVGDAPDVLTSDFAVAMIGTLVGAEPRVNEVLRAGLGHDEVQVVGAAGAPGLAED